MRCEQQASGDTLTVVTTIFPLADFVKNVAGDKVEVVTLLRSGDSPHTYEPSSRDMKAVARARLLVINGAGLDFWVEKLKSAASDNLAYLAHNEGLVSNIVFGSDASQSRIVVTAPRKCRGMPFPSIIRSARSISLVAAAC